jgi:hypothetical protein
VLAIEAISLIRVFEILRVGEVLDEIPAQLAEP